MGCPSLPPPSLFSSLSSSFLSHFLPFLLFFSFPSYLFLSPFFPTYLYLFYFISPFVPVFSPYSVSLVSCIHLIFIIISFSLPSYLLSIFSFLSVPVLSSSFLHISSFISSSLPIIFLPSYRSLASLLHVSLHTSLAPHSPLFLPPPLLASLPSLPWPVWC